MLVLSMDCVEVIDVVGRKRENEEVQEVFIVVLDDKARWVYYQNIIQSLSSFRLEASSVTRATA